MSRAVDVEWTRDEAGRLRPVAARAFKWGAELDSQLRELGRDHSATEIAALLGCSRNAVIGRCFRRGIALKGTDARRAATREANAAAAQARAKQVRASQPKLPPQQIRASRTEAVAAREVVLIAPTVEWQSARVSVADVKAGQCQWPLWPTGAPVSEKFFCGLPALPSGSYCAHCRALSYSPQFTRDIDRRLNLKRFTRRAA